jgi:spore germination protein GerM
LRARAAVLAAALAACACSGRDGGAERGGQARQAERAEAAGEEPGTTLSSKKVKLYFPSSSSDTLVTEEREIFETASPVDRAKQILAELLSGPAGSGAVAAVPEGTALKQVYVLADGTAYVNFSSELARGMAGGSSDEILAIYAIVDSLALNVPEIRRVAILVEGRGRGTLAGHIDIRRPFRPDRTAS